MAAAVAALLATGCATVKDTYSADGRKAYTLNCSGAARGWDKCYKAAGDLCQASGYDVLDRTGEDASFVNGTANSSGASVFGAKTQERSMVVACKRAG
jgi:hypothetical protein